MVVRRRNSKSKRTGKASEGTRYRHSSGLHPVASEYSVSAGRLLSKSRKDVEERAVSPDRPPRNADRPKKNL